MTRQAARRCTDCNALPSSGVYEHEQGCPLFHDLEAVKADDATWLSAHPGEVRERALTAAERAEFVMLHGRDPETDQVAVARFGDTRVRMFKGARPTPRGYETSGDGPLGEAVLRILVPARQLVEEFRAGGDATLVLVASGGECFCSLCEQQYPDPVAPLQVPCQVSAEDARTVLVVLGACASCLAELGSRAEAIQP